MNSSKHRRPEPHKRNRLGALLLAGMSFVGAYVAASFAINSGSLRQYCLTIVALVFGFNRLIYALRAESNQSCPN